MNLPFTQTPEAAADWVKAFRPTMVYPYHYGMSNVEQFRMLVGNKSACAAGIRGQGIGSCE